MGSLSSAMEWWDEWKLRILVLCSISVQLFLAFSLCVRNWYCLRRLRVMVWIAYIGGDALAIYALATLFNRQTKQQQTTDGGGGGTSALEVIWAPVLLIHLGGQQLTAYSLEDNELWKRHTITLVSQVTVALYVFCKWWSGEKRLLLAAVLLFVVGILRFCQKPWSLRWASYGTLASSNLSLTIVDTYYSQEEYVQKARDHVKKGPDEATNDEEAQRRQGVSVDLGLEIVKRFLGVHGTSFECGQRYRLPQRHTKRDGGSTPYYVRFQCLHSFLKVGNGSAQHQQLRAWITTQFLLIYTKMLSTIAASAKRLGICLALVLPGLTMASVVLFAKSDKNGYSKSDVTVTYILFSATVVTEFGAPCLNILAAALMSLPLVRRLVAGRVLTWPDMVSQHNIMLFSARIREKKTTKKKWMMMMMPATLMTKLAAASSYLRNYIVINTKHWYVWHVPAAEQISVLVRQHAEYGWKEYIRDAATYRRFNTLRGDHTLRKHHLLELLGIFDANPFDACVLIWHLATDLCLHGHPSGTASSSSSSSSHRQGASSESRRNGEIISNHMIYLLFICPEMLMPGTSPLLFTNTCFQIEALMMKEADEPSSSSLDETSHGSIAQHICRVMEGGDPEDLLTRAPIVVAAYEIAKLLITRLEEETERWDVIQGVWVEMLCYSASKSRAYEHAKSLAYGGEYLTNAWLLWFCMGMEIFPDRMQMPGPPEPDPAAEQ